MLPSKNELVSLESIPESFESFLVNHRTSVSKGHGNFCLFTSQKSRFAVERAGNDNTSVLIFLFLSSACACSLAFPHSTMNQAA